MKSLKTKFCVLLTLTFVMACIMLAGCKEVNKSSELPTVTTESRPAPEATPELAAPTPVSTPEPTPEPSAEPDGLLPEPSAAQYLEPAKKELAKLPLPDDSRLVRALDLLTVSPRVLGSESEKEAAEMLQTELSLMGYDLFLHTYDQSSFVSPPKICEITADSKTYKLTFVSGPENDIGDYPLYYWDIKLPLPSSIKGKIVVTPSSEYARLLIGAVKEMPSYVISLDYAEDLGCPTLIAKEPNSALAESAKKGSEGNINISAGLQNYTSSNVIAYEKANAGKPVIIVSAHYDSEYLAPGALDNGCGVSSLLEIARLYKGTSNAYDVRFVFFSGEEYYMVGSKAYSLTLSEADRGNVKGLINLDMFGSPEKPMFVATCSGKRNELTDEFLKRIADYFPRTPGLKKENLSDHETFDKLGIPSLLVSQDPVPGVYHSPSDTPDKVSVENMRTVCEWTLAYLLNLE